MGNLRVLEVLGEREGKADREGKRDTWSSLGRNGVNCVWIALAAARVLRRREWREMGWK